MTVWAKLPDDCRQTGEEVLWEGPAAVMTAAKIGNEPHPIDIAGVDWGFAVLTDEQLIIGNFTRIGKNPDVWDVFQLSDITPNTDHSEGVAFIINQFGPIDLVMVMPPPHKRTSLRKTVESLI